MDFQNYIPHRASPYITKWISELDIDIRFVNARKTKLGDYRFRNNQHFVTVNNNLNKYATLITLTHEIAHAFTFAEFGKNIKPHGIQWKENFKKLMLIFFDYNFRCFRIFCKIAKSVLYYIIPFFLIISHFFFQSLFIHSSYFIN